VLFGTNTNHAVQGTDGATCTIGEILLTAGSLDTVNTNSIVANGQTLPIAGNTALFSVIGINYGGDGTSNFKVPDLTADAPNGMTYSICDQGVFP
jgi:microcystin-dependent protein